MTNPQTLITSVYADPDLLGRLSLGDMDLLIRQARRADLLARLYVLADKQNLLKEIPDKAVKHLASAYTVAARHAELIKFEFGGINQALMPLNVQVIVLKGAAYLLAGRPAAKGRFFADIDIMVPQAVISQVEMSLQRKGWIAGSLDAYDQKYYRKWMHEIPPLQHAKRQTMLDVHHAILPVTARLQPSSEKLFESAIPLKNFDNTFVLCPEDMVLHSATHLFHDDEFKHGLRDLFDLDSLLRDFSSERDFWEDLVERAKTIDLSRPLFYALRYSQKILGTPVPEKILERAGEYGSPPGYLLRFMDKLFYRALQPDHQSCHDRFTGLAKLMLYIRSHWLRMPLYLLLPHLFHKAVISPLKARQAEKQSANKLTIEGVLAEQKKPG